MIEEVPPHDSPLPDAEAATRSQSVGPRSHKKVPTALRSLSPLGSTDLRRPPSHVPIRSSSARRLDNTQLVVVRQPSRRCLQMLQRANSAPNLFDIAGDDSNGDDNKNTSTNRSSQAGRRRRNASERRTNSARIARRSPSTHNARQPRRSTRVDRWQHPQGIRNETLSASPPRRPQRSEGPEESPIFNIHSVDSPPQKSIRSISPPRDARKDRIKTPPRRTVDSDEEDEDRLLGDSSHSSSSRQSVDLAPKKPERSRPIKNEKQVDRTLLGYCDPEEEAKKVDDELSFRMLQPSRRFSCTSSSSLKSCRSFDCVRLVRSRRASMGATCTRATPGRAKSLAAVPTSHGAEEFAGVKRRHMRSMDMTLGFVTGTGNTISNRLKSNRFSKEKYSFSGVVLGNSSSFKLNRAEPDDFEEQRRMSLKDRRCRSMDLSPAMARRASSPENDRIYGGTEDMGFGRAEDSSRSCDVSTLIDAMSRSEAEDMTVFTNRSNSSEEQSNTRRGSVGTLSLGSLSLGSGFGSSYGGSFTHLSPKKTAPKEPSPPLKVRTPANVSDLLINMDQDEGEYVIFIGDKRDCSNNELDENEVDASARISAAASFGMDDQSLGYRDPDSKVRTRTVAGNVYPAVGSQSESESEDDESQRDSTDDDSSESDDYTEEEEMKSQVVHNSGNDDNQCENIGIASTAKPIASATPFVA